MNGAIVNGVITSVKEKLPLMDLEVLIYEITSKLPSDVELIEIFPQTKKQTLDGIRKVKVCSIEGTKEMKINILKSASTESQLSFVG